MNNCHTIFYLLKADIHFFYGSNLRKRDVEFMASIPYVHIIGSPQYLITYTKYDLIFAVHHMV